MPKALKIILIVIGVIVAIAGIIIAVLIATTGKESNLSKQFVSNLAGDKTSVAYDMFSDELKQAQALSTFKNQTSTLKLDSSCRLEVSGLASSTGTSNGVSKKISGTIECSSKKYQASFVFNDKSKLTAYSIKP